MSILTYDNIKLARRVLTEALSLCLDATSPFPGAVEQADPAGVFCEAKRNLGALVKFHLGAEAWEKLMASED